MRENLVFFFISVGHRTQEEQNNKMEQKMKSKTTGVKKMVGRMPGFLLSYDLCVHTAPLVARKGHNDILIDNEKGLS
jgi:hypothetical protein